MPIIIVNTPAPTAVDPNKRVNILSPAFHSCDSQKQINSLIISKIKVNIIVNIKRNRNRNTADTFV